MTAQSDIPVLAFEDVSYDYGGISAVEHVTMRVEQGDFVAIVGPNGSGKSTLLKLGLGLLKPTGGSVTMLGTPMERFSQWARIGYVPQLSTGVNSRFPITVAEVVAHGRYAKFSPTAFWRRSTTPDVLQALDMVGAHHLSGRRIGDLSIGQQQRVLVARALVRKPDLLVLDEPIAGVDVHGEQQLSAVLRELNQAGTTILMVSHDVGAVMRDARTCACINHTLMFHGAPHDLTQHELAQLYGFPVEVLLHDALHEHR